LGVPIVKVFDVSLKPERASVAEVYHFIKEEIALAEQISVVGTARSERITKDAVWALKSKIQLLMHDFSEAATTAQVLINSGRYPLVTTESELLAGWRNDTWSEDILLMSITAAEPQHMNNLGIFDNQDAFSSPKRHVPGMLPTQPVVNLFLANAGDLRNNVYLSNPATDMVKINNADRPGVVFIRKWPMNSLYVPNTFYHKQKVARIAEQYLIAAEALHASGGNGLSVLNELRTKRGAPALNTWSDEELRNEWVREMIGEGVRVECLKRWHIGFGGSQILSARNPQNADIIEGGNNQAEYAQRECRPDYYRLTLPVPENEMLYNASIKQTPEWNSLEP
jgi:hypothetical protein